MFAKLKILLYCSALDVVNRYAELVRKKLEFEIIEMKTFIFTFFEAQI